MAGDWIKFRKKLLKDGRVKTLSRLCHAHSVTVIGALVTLWSLADDYAEDSGLLPGYTTDDINREVGIENFCESMPEDWMLVKSDGSILLPNYQQHNGLTAKKRAGANQRQASRRRHAREANVSRTQRDKSVTREEKRGEEKKEENPLPLLPFASSEFATAWSEWIAHRAEIKKPLKARAIEAQFEVFRKWGEGKSIESIRASIRNQWQGLFEPKEDHEKHRGGSDNARRSGSIPVPDGKYKSLFEKAEMGSRAEGKPDSDFPAGGEPEPF